MDYTRIKLALGITYYQSMHVKTAMSLITALREWPYDVQACLKSSSYLHWNRESIVQMAKNIKATHLWFVDTDVIFETDGLKKLVMSDKDIIGGSYNQRQNPPRPVVKYQESDGSYTDLTLETMPKRPFRCAVVPTGFMLIRMAALDGIDPPYFETVAPVGDDVFFCQKLRAAGREIWCDPTIKIGHVGEAIY